MLGNLISFATERAKSLVSKKVGAAVLGEIALEGTEYQGTALLVYIVCQALVDAVRVWVTGVDGE